MEEKNPPSLVTPSVKSRMLLQALRSMFTAPNLATVGKVSAIGAALGLGSALLPNFMENPTRRHQTSALNTHEVAFLNTNPDALEKLLVLENLLKLQTPHSDKIMGTLLICFDLLSGLEYVAESGTTGLSTNYQAFPVVCMIKKVTAQIARMRCVIHGLEADIHTVCQELDQLADDSMYNISQILSGLVMESRF